MTNTVALQSANPPGGEIKTNKFKLNRLYAVT